MTTRISTTLGLLALGFTLALSAKERDTDGKTLFEKHCAACHQSDGLGFETSPPLAGSSWVAGSDRRLIRIVLHGLHGPIEVAGKTYHMEMPGFGQLLSDEEIASLLSFIRRRWGHASPPVTAETVTRVRAASQNRTGYWTVEELLEEP